jgi:hypothetical protein
MCPSSSSEGTGQLVFEVVIVCPLCGSFDATDGQCLLLECVINDSACRQQSLILGYRAYSSSRLHVRFSHHDVALAYFANDERVLLSETYAGSPGA